MGVCGWRGLKIGEDVKRWGGGGGGGEHGDEFVSSGSDYAERCNK